MVCNRLAKHLLLELNKVFSYKEPISLFYMPVLKVLEPDIRDYQIDDAFQERGRAWQNLHYLL